MEYPPRRKFPLGLNSGSGHNVCMNMLKHSLPPRAFSRREFLNTTAVATAALAAPLIIPARLRGADAPSNRIRVGHIGCGRIAQSHDMEGVANSGLAESVAVCDLDSRRADSGKARIE